MTARTIRLKHLNKNGRPVGYFGFFNNMKHLKEIFERHGIDQHTLVQPVLIEGVEISSDRIQDMFSQLNKIIVPKREESGPVKHGKVPTKKQKEAMQKAGLDPKNWLVVKNLTGELHLVNRETPSKKRVVPA
ncbi:DUF6906 family protein [Priestia flexa]|uniref:DUF6906 family protein n=1 Tax=Priestia flexa TaxID=86664 RepID=UPI002490D689|nr:hypothetical protein [Priestia flexa]